MSSSAPDRLGRALRAAQRERRLPSISGAAFRGNEVVWAEAVGLADVEGGRDATPEDAYMVGSITKTFTAAAIFQLRDAGALELDDPLERHLRDAGHGEATIGRMLAHLSGIQRELPGNVWETLEFPEREELLSSVSAAERVLRPGERWHYSNLAYALLGEVVARRSGIPYERYVEERLLGPIGLGRTGWRPEEPAACGYYVEPYTESVRRERRVEKRALSAAGALWSTPADLCRWAGFLAHPDPGVLAPSSAEEMRQLQTMADTERWTIGFGRGLMLFRDGDRVFAGHGGATIGFRAGFAFAPTERIGAAALANASTGMEHDLAVELARTALEEHGAELEPWRPGEAPPPEVESIVGSWWSEGEQVVFRYRNGRLEASSADASSKAPPLVLAPDGPDAFRVVSGAEHGERMSVVRDDAGRPVKLYLATYPFTREPRGIS